MRWLCTRKNYKRKLRNIITPIIEETCLIAFEPPRDAECERVHALDWLSKSLATCCVWRLRMRRRHDQLLPHGTPESISSRPTPIPGSCRIAVHTFAAPCRPTYANDRTYTPIHFDLPQWFAENFFSRHSTWRCMRSDNGQTKWYNCCQLVVTVQSNAECDRYQFVTVRQWS